MPRRLRRPCREIHGRSYRLFVTVRGVLRRRRGDPKCGMVLDFGVLKRIVREEIVARFDHAFVLRRSAAGNESLGETLARRFGNIVRVDYQPTCENMLDNFARRIRRRLRGVALHALRLRETATSFASGSPRTATDPPAVRARGGRGSGPGCDAPGREAGSDRRPTENDTPSSDEKTLFLVDAYALLFKYYYTFLGRPMRNRAGTWTPRWCSAS